MVSEVVRIINSSPVKGKVPGWLSRVLSRPIVFGSLIPIATLLNAVVGMVLPQMMQPREFGEYSLVVTLFNYGLIFDLGISQVIDRRLPAYLGSGQPELARRLGDQMLWLRLAVAIVTFLLTVAALALLSIDRMLPFGLAAGALAALAGLADMVALGPVCIHRARTERRDYAIRIAILLSGLIFARLGGLIAGGITGCFAALAVWYICCALLFHRQMPLRMAERPEFREGMALIAYGTPFFATAFIWAFYVTGNRWIASFLIAPDQFGQFAFSANIFSLLVGAAGGFSAFYYPKVVERIAGLARFSQSGLLTRDLIGLTVVVSFGMAVGIALAGYLIRLIYPQYIEGVETARIILVAVPPMVLASWLMPISLSAGSRPLVDGLLIYPLATVILGIAITLLYHRFGDAGAAWASTVSALALIGMQLATLRHAAILKSRDASILFVACVFCCCALGGLVWMTS